jgi:hypothetical protein
MTETQKSTCKHCGRAISLVPWGKHYKWVDGRMSWHCGSDPAFPTRTHAPGTQIIQPGDAAIARVIQVTDIPGATP